VLSTPPAFVLSQDQTLRCPISITFFLQMFKLFFENPLELLLSKNKNALSSAADNISKSISRCKYFFMNLLKKYQIFLRKKSLNKVRLKKESGDDLLSRSSHRNSTISAGGLNFSVRYGKRCFPVAIVTRILVKSI
jgi:hypothetical protein